MNYPDSVRYLYSLGNELKTLKFGLETITAVIKALGHPERRCRFVHVAGTNGKSTTAELIERLLTRKFFAEPGPAADSPISTE